MIHDSSQCMLDDGGPYISIVVGGHLVSLGTCHLTLGGGDVALGGGNLALGT